MPEEVCTDAETLRAYKAPWKGKLVLVCRKCRKKLKEDGKKSKSAKLVRKIAKLSHSSDALLHIVDVPCLKLCPKGGVTVCTAEQVARNECSIVRTKRDLQELVEQCQRPM
jgi:predicted metal-binding protein